MLMEVVGFGQVILTAGVFGNTVTVKWQEAAGVPTEFITLHVTMFVPIGKFEPLGGEQITLEPGGQLLITGGG